MQKQKVELNANAVKMYIDLHKKIRMPFTVSLSNYVTELKSERYHLQFMKNAQGNRVFVAYNMIKADCLKQKVEPINAALLRYYQTNFNFSEIYADEIYNVDLKSAYATVLLNEGFLSDATFSYISTLPKMERLASVGMLAGRKNVFEHDESGKIVSQTEQVSPTSDYFFYAVLKTYDVINECKKMLGNDFLFSWVDGVYFKNKANGEFLAAFLQTEHKLNCSFDVLTEFEIKRRKGHYLLSYLKDGEPKLFNIPLPETQTRQDLYNYLLSKNY